MKLSSLKTFLLLALITCSLPTRRNICFSLQPVVDPSSYYSTQRHRGNDNFGLGIIQSPVPVDSEDSTSHLNRPNRHHSSSRRNLLLGALIIPVASSVPLEPKPAKAIEETSSSSSGGGGATEETSIGTGSVNRGGKPFAPLSALLPAARLKITVDQMYELSLNLKSDNSKQKQYQILVQMNDIWTTRPPLFQKNDNNQQQRTASSSSLAPSSTTPGSTAQLTTGISSANKRQYKEIRKDLSIPDRMAAILNQADVERQWGMLQYQESKREQGSPERAAFNLYTSQLVFGESYVLTANPEERKRLIRNDELPSLTAVITSDLDLRDLYRNDFLTAIEDATAEIAYQIKNAAKEEEADVTDVVELMEQAHTSIAKWFDLVAPSDVQEAMEVVGNER